MSNPVTSYNEYLKELESVSERLADANGLRGSDSFQRWRRKVRACRWA
jgi:hypothetical protein